jgi:hypothetical protein
MSEQQGQCTRCQAVNAYSLAACMTCGARLPWADAVDAMRREVAERTAQEQAQKLALAQEQAKVAKAEAKLKAKSTSITQRQNSPITPYLVCLMVLFLLGFAAFLYVDSRRHPSPAYTSSESSSSSLTLAAFNQLTTGMSPDAATAILGEPSSTSSFEMSGVTTIGYNWSSGGAMISAAFQNGGLVTKSQSGLQ